MECCIDERCLVSSYYTESYLYGQSLHDAIELFSRAHGRSELTEGQQLKLAGMLAKEERFQESLDISRRLLTSEGGDIAKGARTLALRAAAQLERDDEIVRLAEGLALDEMGPSMLVSLMQVYCRTGDLERAWKIATLLIQQGPDCLGDRRQGEDVPGAPLGNGLLQ